MAISLGDIDHVLCIDIRVAMGPKCKDTDIHILYIVTT